MQKVLECTVERSVVDEIICHLHENLLGVHYDEPITVRLVCDPEKRSDTIEFKTGPEGRLLTGRTWPWSKSYDDSEDDLVGDVKVVEVE